jgi:uncharacterized protein YneF (UPF0154 family)
LKYITLGIILIVILGLIGWVLGFYFSTPPFPFGQGVLYSLGKIAVIIGPIVMICGVIAFTGSIFISRKKKPVQDLKEDLPKQAPPKITSFETKTAFKYESLFLGLTVIIVILGLIGWVLGFFFTQPYWYNTGHTVIYAYGQLAITIGPEVAVIGLILFVFFHILIKK